MFYSPDDGRGRGSNGDVDGAARSSLENRPVNTDHSTAFVWSFKTHSFVVFK